MSNHVSQKIKDLDKEILGAAKANELDISIVQKKVKTQKSLTDLLIKRQEAEDTHREDKNKQLSEDDVYQATKEAGDEDMLLAMQHRTLTKEQYDDLAKQYKVYENTVTDYDPQNEESKETISNLPSPVAKQEKDAITYFEENKETKHLKVVEGIQKLRKEGKVTYEDIGGGKYKVTMSCGGRKVTMEFPPDTKIADSSDTYTGFDGKNFTIKEVTRRKLWSKEGEKHLEQKEKEGEKLLFESEFKTLIQSLYPEGTEQEQILAFMMATGFYGRMRLSDKKGDYQRAVFCFRFSVHRFFVNLYFDVNECSLVHSTFVG